MKSSIIAAVVISFAAAGAAYAQNGQAGGETASNFKSTTTRAAVEGKAEAAEKAGKTGMKGGQEGGETRSHFKSKVSRRHVRHETKKAMKAGEIPAGGQAGQ